MQADAYPEATSDIGPAFSNATRSLTYHETHIPTGQYVERAVAAALMVRERPGQPLQQTLQDALRTRDLLLVLDNCEHVLDACARLVEELTRYAPGLRILATSREPLRVGGELTWSMSPLSFPGPTDDMSVTDLERFEATQLFVDRARALDHNFSPTVTDASLIGAICRQLDGLPLAIELAAARVTVLSCKQITDRLGEALHLLVTGARNAPPRQQTLRATLDWSHQLLFPHEQRLLRRLSIFAGSWTLEAAEDVCGTDASAPGAATVVDALQGLSEKSLVSHIVVQGEPRFRLLETIREYAAERLAQAGEADEWRNRHLDWCLGQVERSPITTPEALAELARDQDNFRAALRWSLETGAIERGLRLAASFWRFWYMSGHYSEGIGFLGELLARPGAREPSPVGVEVLIGAGQLGIMHGHYSEAEGWLTASLELAEALADLPGCAAALHFLGTLAYCRGDPEGARVLYEKSLLVQNEPGGAIPRHPQHITMLQLARLDLIDGNAHAAERRAEDVATRAQSLNRSWGVAGALQTLGVAAHIEGDSQRAQMLLERSLSIYRDIEHPQGIGRSLMLLGMLAHEHRDYTRASNCLTEALGVAHQLDDMLLTARVLEELGAVAIDNQQPSLGGGLMGSAVKLRQMLGGPPHDPWASPPERARTEFWQRAARRALGEQEYRLACQSGQSWSFDQAMRAAGSVRSSTIKTVAKEHLTAREREVAILVAQGYTNQRIAAQLVVTAATVAKHVEHILDKLGFTSRVQIAAWIISGGDLEYSHQRFADLLTLPD